MSVLAVEVAYYNKRQFNHGGKQIKNRKSQNKKVDICKRLDKLFAGHKRPDDQRIERDTGEKHDEEKHGNGVEFETVE